MRDAGLQPERTGLAWQRTALASSVAALLLLHHAANAGWSGPVTVPAALGSSIALVIAVAGGVRARRLREARQPGPLPSALPAVLAVLVTATAVAALVTLWW